MFLADRKLEQRRRTRPTNKKTFYGLEIRTELLLGRG
jgi:hypothetical protein